MLPGTDLTASSCDCEHHDHDDHLDLSDCSSEASSSEQTPDSKRRQPVLLAKTQLGIAQAVRIFGGVIIGTGAEEISRSWGQLSDPTFSTPDSGGESDPGYEPFVESFDLSDPSSHQLSGEAPFPDPECSKGLEGDDIGRVSDSSSDRTLPERPVGGLKRKLHSFVEDDSPGLVVTGDATPRAPGGRAAARAKAEGQGCTSFVSECGLPTDKGRFRLRAYRYHGSDKSHEPVVMVAGKVRGREGVPVRVHDQCQTSEVFGSKKCDCREQLDMSLRYIQENGGGAVIYLAQEGRGIGLANKVAAYALQDGGLDTVDANRQLGFEDDQRTYDCVDFILRDMGIKSVQLMTNNPFKIEWLRALGIKVDGRIPVEVTSNEHNHGYLEAKAARMSHLINNL